MKLCITGGGTGGHLMIAEALVEAAVEEGCEVIFIGSNHGQDRNYFEQRSAFSHVYFLETSGVVNQKGLKKIKALYKIALAFLESRKILKKHQIVATYSVGGFSAAAASFATLSRFIPLFIHEQNAVVGRLNALLRPFAKSFVSAYEKESSVSGYPVKELFFETSRVRKRLESIIFLGGSHGAKTINDLALSVALLLKEKRIKIIHQAGEFDYERVRDAYTEMGVEVELYGFTKEMPKLIVKADLAVSRAGASTLWELCANGCPALFVPYPYAAADHQYHNAAFVVENEMGWCQREGERLQEKLLEVVNEPLELKSQKLLSFATKDVAKKMIQELMHSL